MRGSVAQRAGSVWITTNPCADLTEQPTVMRAMPD
jgi:hypothetical protein